MRVRVTQNPPPELRDEVDPREHDELFQRLPDSAKEEFRARWRREAENDARIDGHRYRTRRRTVLEGVFLFFVIETFFGYFSFWRSLLSLGVGAAVGYAWYRTRVRRFGYIVIGLAPHLGFRYVFGFGDPFTTFFGALMFMCLAAGLGIGHESRLADGTDVY